MRLNTVIRSCIVIAAASVTVGAQAQGQRDVQIRPVKIAGNVYVLYGQGGNIGLSIGDDGAFMIDDQFAPLTGKILEAVKTLTDQPVRFVINTHWHGDHTGGNENLGDAGAIIVAHKNVRKAMTEEHFMEAFNQRVPPSPEGALPVITFNDSIDFYWNDEEIHVFHVKPAHTDGDSIIHFRKADVFHMGDTYFSSGYPFIDTSTGGNIDGMIAAADIVIRHASDTTRIIPGHGEVTGVKELGEYRDMLQQVRDRIATLIESGKSKEEVVAARPTKDFDTRWGQSFMQPDVWVGIVYDGMQRETPEPHDHH